MPRLARSSWMSGGVARVAVLALAAGLGVAALCLVVFGSSQRQLQLGVLLGLWAALVAACLPVLARAGRSDAEPAPELAEARAQAAELHQAQLEVIALQREQLEASQQAFHSSEIELRQFNERQLVRDAGARQESELRLQAALGREVERVLLSQLASLREEVAALRAEMVDKLGGQLRLERIETTRVIGSDLEALQHEIRRLSAARAESIAAPAPLVRNSHDIVDAELVEFPPPATALPVVAVQPSSSPADPFAALPRLSPLRADLGLIPDAEPVGGQPGSGGQRTGRRRAPDPELPADHPPADHPLADTQPAGAQPAGAQPADDPRYQGRRRADGLPADRLASLDT